MITARTGVQADQLATKIINLFERRNVRSEIAMQALTRVIAIILCDQDNVPEKITALVHNIGVLEQRYRAQMKIKSLN